jgi:hypothetical protein
MAERSRVARWPIVRHVRWLVWAFLMQTVIWGWEGNRAMTHTLLGLVKRARRNILDEILAGRA